MISEKPCIVLLDSGVKNNLITDNIKQCVTLIYDNEKNSYGSEPQADDYYGHGTAIFSIVNKLQDKVDIYIIKIFENEEAVTEGLLIEALRYIDLNIKANIINLSLGINICDNYSELYAICKKLVDKGVIIVSALDNNGAISYPAAFDCVIGVNAGISCKTIHDFEFMEDSVINLGAYGKIQRVAWTNPEFLMIGGNSFAAAHVTVQTAKFWINGYRTREDILKQFKAISVKQYVPKPYCEIKQDLIINKAVLFPFNKEMHSLIRFHHLLSFQIEDIYDIKYSGRVKSNTAHLMQDKTVKSYQIKNIDDIEWDKFDTLILGHMDELLSLVNTDELRNEILSKAVAHKKNIYTFDDLYQNQILKGYSKIYSPRITEDNLPPLRFGKLYHISKPVIGIFGTSSRQGKFTLQLKLRDKFITDQYDVGQVGTEPSASLFGMDYTFPIGYNSSVYIKEFDVVRYLNHCINNLCIQEKEIILVGSQSGTIPYEFSNITLFTIPQYTFLLGTKPDIVILCINPYDADDYIERTMKTIEASVSSKVISLVVFPMKLKNNWTGIYGGKEPLPKEEFLEIKERLTDKFNIPVYRIDQQDDIDSLYKDIIDYF